MDSGVTYTLNYFRILSKIRENIKNMDQQYLGHRWYGISIVWNTADEAKKVF